jgi:plastocyanin
MQHPRLHPHRLTVLLLAILLPSVAGAATVTVQVLDNAFSPATVHISEGDTVRWVKHSRGSHNVRADDNEFSSGTPTYGEFTFEHTFAASGRFRYRCDVHYFTMIGNVQVAASDLPGTIGLTAAQVSAGESDGQVTLELARSGGDAGAVAVTVTTADGSAQAGADYDAAVTLVRWGDGESGTMVVEIPLRDDALVEPDETFTVSLSSPEGGAVVGLATTTVAIGDDDAPVTACAPNRSTVCALGGRFQIRATWTTPDGRAAQARSLPTGVDGPGLFVFATPRQVALLVQLVDGCAANGHQWVFVAAASDAAWRLSVVDTAGGKRRTYAGAEGAVSPLVADTAAFNACP